LRSWKWPLRRHGYHLKSGTAAPRQRRSQPLPDVRFRRTVTALIRYGSFRPDREHDLLVAIRRRGLPVVAVDPDPRRNWIWFTLMWLKKRGSARRTCRTRTSGRLVRGRWSGWIRARTRLVGYRRAVANGGVQYDETLVIPWPADVNRATCGHGLRLCHHDQPRFSATMPS